MDYLKLKHHVIRHNTRGRHRFIDRQQQRSKLCIVLIGYKEFLWADVLGRFCKFMPSDVDVCLLSSGKHLEKVEKLAEEHGWSYLSTSKNNVCLAQNICIDKFPSAKLIYKMDEDMFLTEGVFEKLESAMVRADAESPYNIGIAAPLININAYGYYRILDKIGKLDVFRERFGVPKMASGQNELVESNPDFGAFMWGSTGDVPTVDELNRMFSSCDDYTICPIRLSIGFILMKRSFWEGMWCFPVLPGNGMGLDETIAIGYASAFSKAVVVAENSVVGHFGYGPQSEMMKKLYSERKDLF